MKILEGREVKKNLRNYAELLKDKVFIYPTDTIYGLGGDATKHKIVEKIRKIKKRPIQAMSVIAPSMDWIYYNFEINERVEKWLKKLPGPYTLILKTKKGKKPVAGNVAPGLNTVGIRIPDHWIRELVNLIGKPIITTSVNLVGECFMTDLEDLNEEIKEKVDFIIYEGKKKARPSTLVHLEGEEEKIIER